MLDGDLLDHDLEGEVRPLCGTGGSRGAWRYTAAGSLDAMIAAAASADDSGFDSYLGVHPRRRGAGRGGAASIPVLAASIADVDCHKTGVDPGFALRTAMQAPWGPPSIAVWSGGGWHLYWCYRERIDAEVRAVGEHQRFCQFVRAWFDEALGAACADDMSGLDRVLRVPGTRNHKPERRRPDGSAPTVRLVVCEPERRYNLGELLDHVPQEWMAATVSASGTRLHSAISPRLRNVLCLLDIKVRVRRTQAGVSALALKCCPACGDTGGSCYLTPIAGRLVSFRERQCPAGLRQSGPRPDGGGAAGIPLLDWLARYVDPAGLDARARRALNEFMTDFGPAAPEIPACRVATFAELESGLLERTVDDAFRRACPDRLTVLAITTGGGKTRIALVRALAEIAAGRTVVFAVLDHAKADEALRTVEHLISTQVSVAPAGAFQVIRGALYHCVFHQQADEITRSRIAAAFASGGRVALCRGCPHSATCDGSVQPAARNGALTITTHAGLATLKFPSGDAPLVIIDEAVETMVGDPLPLNALREPLSMMRCLAWRQEQPDAAGTLERIHELLSELAASACAKAAETQHAAHVQPAEIWSALRQDPVLRDLLRGWVNSLDPTQVSRPPGPPEPFEDEARRPTGRFSNPRAWQLVAGERYLPFRPDRRGGLVEDLLRGVETAVFIRVVPGGTVEILRPQLASLPAGAAVVMLDATAHLIRPDLEALALANGRVFEPEQDLTRLAVRGVAPAAALWLDTGSYARPKTVVTGYDVEAETDALDARVPARLRRMYLAAQEAGAAIGRKPLRAGLLTWLPAAQRLRSDSSVDPVALACRNVVEEARTRGVETVFIGHHGRDGKATNAFIEAGCDTLLHYGDPRPDWGLVAEVEAGLINAVRVAAGLKSVSTTEIYRGRQGAAVLQDIGRARHSRPENASRPWVLVYAGNRPPRLMEAAWRRIDVAAARVGSLDEEPALGAIRGRLDECGAVTLRDAVDAIEAVCEIAPSRRSVERLLARIRRERGLTKFVLNSPNGRLAILAPDRSQAESHLTSQTTAR